MATKAELEAELADLRRKLAERPSPDAQETDPPEPPDEDDKSKEINWDREVADILSELEEFPHKKPLLLALGALALGYLIGRSR